MVFERRAVYITLTRNISELISDGQREHCSVRFIIFFTYFRETFTVFYVSNMKRIIQACIIKSCKRVVSVPKPECLRCFFGNFEIDIDFLKFEKT